MAAEQPPGGEGEAPPRPTTRAAQQEETRQALIRAAHVVFARDGYHGATLDGIAREAGYSKGAVYSNFAGKADLFLQVLDRTLEVVETRAWDPTQRAADDSELAAVGEVRTDDPITDEQLSRGFGLATLEVLASAGRDAELMGALRQRLDVLVGAYARVAARERTAGEPLDERALGLLLAAFDQGFALFALAGSEGLSGTAFQQGLRRLLRPADAD